MYPSRFRLFAGALFALGLTILLAGHDPRAGEPKQDESKKALILPPVFARDQPESVEDLKAIEDHVQAVLPRILPAVVGVRVGPAQGSGVVVDKEGHVLTAGHVSGEPKRNVVILLPGGKQLKGKSLGKNGSVDSGMIQIIDPPSLPHVELGKSSQLKKGQWVMAIGHPGGFRSNRAPVVRLGRVLFASPFVIRTDCTLVGGDSGGPLFDMNGRLIGIHSRIGTSISENVHVPVDAYRKEWDRLARGESFGGQLGTQAVVQSAGGKIVYEKKGALTAKDKFDTKQKESYVQIHVFKMVPGSAYTIDMIRAGKKLTDKFDPFLRVEDARGKQLAEDDDGAGNLNARIVFRPTDAGEYRIIVTTFDPGQTGAYTLVIRQAELRLVGGKVDVFAALRVHRLKVQSLVDKMGKEGTKVYTSGFLFDDNGKPVAGKTIEFRWDKGLSKIKSDSNGALKLPLSKQILKDLMVDVPAGLKVTLDLTDQAGNPLVFDPKFEQPSKKSAGGKRVFQQEGELTAKDAIDKTRDKGCFSRQYTFKMAPGSTYTLDLESSDFDSYLRLEDPGGRLIAEDDDSGGKLNSRIVVSPDTDGLYRIVVTSCDPAQTGHFRLSVYQADGKKTAGE